MRSFYTFYNYLVLVIPGRRWQAKYNFRLHVLVRSLSPHAPRLNNKLLAHTRNSRVVFFSIHFFINFFINVIQAFSRYTRRKCFVGQN
jgi:hypothetical protein